MLTIVVFFSYWSTFRCRASLRGLNFKTLDCVDMSLMLLRNFSVCQRRIVAS